MPFQEPKTRIENGMFVRDFVNRMWTELSLWHTDKLASITVHGPEDDSEAYRITVVYYEDDEEKTLNIVVDRAMDILVTK